MNQDDQPFNLEALIDAMSPAEREHLMEYGLSGRPDTSGRMPAHKKWTKENDQY